MTLDEFLARELTDDEHDIFDKAVTRGIWDAVNDAFGFDVFGEVFGDEAEEDLKENIADELITNIGGLLGELGSLAPKYVAERHFLRDILDGKAVPIS
jgi:hypothetical protein